MNLADIFLRTIVQYSKKTALIENETIITYGDLRRRIDSLSMVYRAIGIRENHRIALILPNGADFICSFFALLKLKAIISPLSPECTPYELKGIFNNLNPHAIITQHTVAEKMGGAYPELLNKRRMMITPDVIAAYRERLGEGGDSGVQNAEVSGCGEPKQNDSVATINYTYRGLGFPLGAQLSHNNYFQAILFYITRTELDEQQRVLLVLPSYHVFALMGGILAPLFAGATVVIAKSLIISHIVSVIKHSQITMLLAVPTLYRLLLDYCRDPSDLRSVRFCITGGDIMSAEMHEEFFSTFNVPVLQGYGLTECLPVTCNPSLNNRVGSLGLPGRADVRIRIVNESGSDMEPGKTGEIIVQSPTVMLGYYRQDDATREVLKGNWLYTGDYGFLDAAGYLHFAGRKKNVVKVGGKLVDPLEVKAVLLSYPGIEEVSLSAVEDRLWGNIIAAEILMRLKMQPSTREIQLFCSRKLSSYKVPKLITCLERVEVC
ncbi:MAG TPA: class I adenylate-forming enzyme family protein [Nitrospirota bacterium]|nr:class I adenylate-forming enzyme family protein [Nitrospirota bacterium]